ISYKTSSNAAFLYHQQINPETKTQISGILLFGLQLESLYQNREKKLVNKAFKSTLQKNTLKLQDEHSNIDDPKIVCEVVSSIGKGTQRSIKDRLKYIVPNLVKKEILNFQQPVINLRISDIIINEMKKINIYFEFWQESQTWNYTSLIGKDKLKVLQFFDLSKILPLSRAKIIRRLWDKFYNLYIAMCNPITDPNKFKESIKNWLKLFLIPSTGTPDNLVQDGSNGVNQKSVIIQILEFEN
ncbi:637_t:CDS:2, partial [Gigaspora margarita]